MNYNVWFIADMHINHRNILRYSPERVTNLGLKDENDIDGYDDYIYNMWNSTVKRGDHVYLIGDVFLGNGIEALKCIKKLKLKGANLHLIVGNHDKNMPHFKNMFSSIDYIKTVTFKKSTFPFLEEDFRTCLCHYPMMSWPDKCRGAMLLYGHVHQTAPFIDDDTDNLMLNVGFDSPKNFGKLWSLEQVYDEYKSKLSGLTPLDYIEECRKNPKFIG